jgi:hypothetical protein
MNFSGKIYVKCVSYILSNTVCRLCLYVQEKIITLQESFYHLVLYTVEDISELFVISGDTVFLGTSVSYEHLFYMKMEAGGYPETLVPIYRIA